VKNRPVRATGSGDSLKSAKYRCPRILFALVITFSIADLIRDFFLSLETTALGIIIGTIE